MTHLLGTWYPGYRPFFQPMSDLGDEGSPVALITSIWWVIMGLLFVVFGYGFGRAFSNHRGPVRTAAWMIALYGVGEGLGSGLVSGTPGKAFQTPGSIIHNMLGGLGVVAAVSLPFIIMRIFNSPRVPNFHRYSWFTTATGIGFFVLFSISSFYRPEGSWISFTGLWQRLFMLMYYLYFMCLAVLILTRRKTAPI
jgi:hypothetical protein